MHQPGLLQPADHAHLDAGLAVNAVEQLVAVLRFAKRARADCDRVLHAPLVDGVMEPPERRRSGLHDLVGHATVGEYVLAETHGLAAVLHHLDPAVPASPPDSETHGVGTGVDGG